MTASTNPALRIEKIELHNVKQIEKLVLEPNQNGVTVVHGDNESGKSTLIEAFNMLISDTKLKSNKAEVKALKPIGSDEKPMVEATLRIGAYRLTYNRVFSGTTSKATLKIHEPKVESLAGTEAFNRFREILGEHSDETLRSAMSIEQGDILNLSGLFHRGGLPRVIGRVGSSSGVNDTEVVSVAVDEGTQWLMDRAQEEREKYFTPRSRDKWVKSFAMQLGERDAAQQAVEAARQRLSEVDRYTQQIEKSKQELARISVDRQKAKQRVSELDKELAEVKRQEEQLALVAQRVEQTKSAADSLREEKQRRAELRETIDVLSQREAAAEKVVEDVRAKRAEQEKKVKELQAAVNSDRLELDLARAMEVLLRGRGDLKEIAIQLEDVERRKETADELDEQRKNLQQRVDSNAATEKNLRRVEKIFQAWQLATARRDSSATIVSITGPEGAKIQDANKTVELVDGTYETKVSGQRAFRLGDFCVDVRPTGQVENYEADAIQKRNQLIDALKTALGDDSTAGVNMSDQDVEARAAAVRGKAEERARVEEDLREVNSQLGITLGGSSLAELDEEKLRLLSKQQRMERQVVEREADVKERYTTWAQSLPESEKPANIELEELLGRETFDDEWPRDIQARLDYTQQHSHSWVDDVQVEMQKAENHLAAVKTTVSLRRQDLVEAEQKISQQDLELLYNKADEEMEQAKAQRAQLLQKQQGSQSTELVESKLRGKREEIRTLESRQKEAEQKILIAQHELDQAGGSAEELREAETHYQRLQSAVSAAERRAKAADLLVQVFAEVHEEVKARYQAPFLNEFTRLSKSIFGSDVSYQLDADMAIEKRVVEGVDVPLNQLSGGATEQIAMLYRLAAASLMGKGESVPIFLDDTLGYTDVYRTENMNAVLSLMGHEHQIIITTCDVSRFSAIGDAYVTSIAALQ